MSLKSTKRRLKPASADVSRDFHVDLESRFSENATFVFILLPRVKWSVCLSEGRVAAFLQLTSTPCCREPGGTVSLAYG